MKKFFSALLIIGMALGMAGCGVPAAAGPGTERPSSLSGAGQTPAPEPSPAPAPPPVTEASALQVDFIDVGQADSILIESGGLYALVDGGNVADSSRIYTYLNDRGVTHLTYVFGTHPHEDHIGGLSGALSLASAGTVFSPVLSYDSDAFRSFAAKAEPYGGLTIPAAGDKLVLGSALIEVLGLNAGAETNDSSIILKVSCGDTSFLLTGDAEDAAEKAVIGKNLASTVLKVGHHGSETSTSYQFLREVMPKYAVLSVGKNNSYGHPDEAVMSRLRDAGAEVYRTDLQGDIVCKSDGSTVTIVPEKNAGAQTNPTLQPPAPGQYIGNAGTNKFHRANCGALPEERNRVYFSTREEAVNAGMSPCKKCRP